MELLPSSYPDQELLDQPFLLPDNTVISYEVGREGEAFPSPGYGESQHGSVSYTEENFHHQQEQFSVWESCTASLEEVQSAVFSPPVIQIQRLDEEQEVSSTETSGRRRREKKSKKKSAYKHVPHSEKPAHLVAKRNARERRRVEAVNTAFLTLRKAIPLDNKRGKRVSKVKILQRAIDYILNMKDAINQHDGLPSHVYDDKDDDHLFAF